MTHFLLCLLPDIILPYLLRPHHLPIGSIVKSDVSVPLHSPDYPWLHPSYTPYPIPSPYELLIPPTLDTLWFLILLSLSIGILTPCAVRSDGSKYGVALFQYRAILVEIRMELIDINKNVWFKLRRNSTKTNKKTVFEIQTIRPTLPLLVDNKTYGTKNIVGESNQSNEYNKTNNLHFARQ